MEHKHESNIKCPYCDWIEEASYTFEEDSGEWKCGSCGKLFNVERDVKITYSTSRINCEETGVEHNYQFESVYMSKRKHRFKNGNWTAAQYRTALHESEYTYYKIMTCTKCGDNEYIQITKEDYLELL